MLVEVSVLPQVNAEQRSAKNLSDSVHQRVIHVVGLCEDEVWLALLHTEPDPAGQDARVHGLLEALTEAVEARELFLDLFEQLAARFAYCGVLATSGPLQQEVKVATNGKSLGWLIESRGLLRLNDSLFGHLLIERHHQLDLLHVGNVNFIVLELQ